MREVTSTCVARRKERSHAGRIAVGSVVAGTRATGSSRSPVSAPARLLNTPEIRASRPAAGR